MDPLAFAASLALFLLGFVVLVYASDRFIDSSVRLARSTGVSDLVIGLTIVAAGTSLPEIAASFTAFAADKADMAFGNILGSCLVNLTLVVGVSALVAPLSTNHVLLERDTKIMMLVLVALILVVLDPLAPGTILPTEGAILVILVVAYLSFLRWGHEEDESGYQFRVFVDFFIKFRFVTSILRREPAPHKSIGGTVRLVQEVQGTTGSETVVTGKGRIKNLWKDIVIVCISAAALALAARIIIDEAVFLSASLGVAEGFIGYALISVGTSLPELTISINSARKGFGWLLIGNILGSNIVNVTLGIGLPSFFFTSPIDLLSGLLMLAPTLIVYLGFYYILRSEWKVTRREGVVLLAAYVLATLFLYWTLPTSPS